MINLWVKHTWSTGSEWKLGKPAKYSLVMHTLLTTTFPDIFYLAEC